MSPTVSVVMPVFNGESFIAEAVRSALEQDPAPHEVLVIDDGSTDRTRAALEPFGTRVRVITVPNGGPARARNLGLGQARGDYVAFLDADDVWLPGKLRAQVAQLESRRDAGACYTGWHVWRADADGEYRRPEWAGRPLGLPGADAARSGWVYGQLLFDCALLTTTVMLRTSVAREVGLFDVGLRVGEDYDYWLRLSRRTQIVRLDCTGALYRVVPSSASRRPYAQNHELEVVRSAIRRFGLVNPDGQPVDPKAIDRRLRNLLFQHGYQHLKQGSPSIALEAFGESLRSWPWQPKVWAHAANAWLRGRAPQRGDGAS